MSGVRGINHITFAVKNLHRSVDFYQNALGLELKKTFDNGAYLEAGNTWICLSLDKKTRNSPHPDYTHVAFDVANGQIDNIRNNLEIFGAKKWKENKSEGQSFYFLDPDGHRLEIHTGTLQSRLEYMESRS